VIVLSELELSEVISGWELGQMAAVQWVDWRCFLDHKIKIMFNRIVAVACLILSLFGTSDDRTYRQVVVMEELLKTGS
jgi:hypothetical protein